MHRTGNNFSVAVGLEAVVDMQKSKIAVSTCLRDITVYDPTPGALYPKVWCIGNSFTPWGFN